MATEEVALLRSISMHCLESGLSALDRFATLRGRVPALARHLATGVTGEEAAFFFLRRQGFIVVAQRWNESSLPGDIDLIAWQDDTLCFIEVKTRSSREVATASLAVDRHKRRILRRLANQYLRHLPGDEAQDGSSPGRPQTRFDIVTVYQIPGEKRDIRLIPAAFGWREED